MQCPKEKGVQLVSSKLGDGLPTCQCPSCQGNWIPIAGYETWQAQQTQSQAKPQFLDPSLDFEPAPTDVKAGLCPECGSYLARVRIDLKKPFYLERCSVCGGIWCDHGEWEILGKLGLTAKIPQIFSSQWQLQMREKVHGELERQPLFEKLGSELAERVCELADILEKHEHGSFAVAYIMRRFNKDSKDSDRTS